MLLLFQFVTFLLLLLIIYQDFKLRAISWIIIPILLLTCASSALMQISMKQLIINVVLNNLFLFIQIILITLYFSVKQKSIINVLKNYLGIGDLLFLVSISFLFVPVNFILFLISGFLITLLFSGIYYLIRKPEKLTIPLAGVLAIYLIFLFVLNNFISHELFIDDSFIYKIIN